MAKDPEFWKTHTGRAVGEEPVLDGGKQVMDKNGNPVMSPLYSVSSTKGAAEKTHPLTAAEATYIKNNAGDNVTPGTELTLQNFDNVMIRADAANQTRQKIEKANDEELSADQARQLNTVMQDPRIQHYMAMNPGEPLAGLYSAAKNTQAHVNQIDQMIQAVQQKVPTQPGQVNPTVQALQQKRQEFVQEGQNIDKAVSGFNEKAKDDFIKRQDDLAKEQEVERHNRADEDIKRAEAVAKKGGFTGNPDAKSPEEFMASLAPPERATIKMIGEGRAPIHNPSYLLARNPEVMKAVSLAYPDFDISKIDDYQKAYVNFTSGKTSQDIKAGGTALEHLAQLQALNTNASHVPHTAAWTAYQNKAVTLAGELARFYGTDTVEGIANIKDTLTSTLPGNREAAIKTQTESMGSKFSNMEQEWKNAAPSKVYQDKMPQVSLSAKQARAKLDPQYAADHPELGVKSSVQPSQPTPPVGSQTAIRDPKTNQIIGYR
jgi:hypothetical protein